MPSAPLLFKPRYTDYDSVKLRLTSKVRFQQPGQACERGEIPTDLLGQLIVDAEQIVEQDLSNRYATPFRSRAKGTWEALPDSTRRAIRQAVDYKAVVIILATDFGRGGSANADAYLASFEQMYTDALTRLLGQDMEGKQRQRFRFSPPLPDLMLAASNSEADDGVRGRIINTTGDAYTVEDYAAGQVSDPSVGVFTGRTLRGGHGDRY